MPTNDQRDDVEHGKGYGVYVTAAIVVALICTGTAYILLADHMQDRSQWIIALFTVVMTITIALQWIAMIDQNRKFEQQNRHMAKQNEVMIAQNKAIEFQIEDARLEQRAWLGASAPTIDPLVAGMPVKGMLTTINSGRTPATVFAAGCNAFQVGMDADIPESTVREFCEGVKRDLGNREDAVAPEGRRNSFYCSASKLSADVLAGVNAGSIRLYVLGYFAYRDVTGATRETICCFEYDREANALLAYRKYNQMT
jgi:hypothetical protein